MIKPQIKEDYNSLYIQKKINKIFIQITVIFMN